MFQPYIEPRPFLLATEGQAMMLMDRLTKEEIFKMECHTLQCELASFTLCELHTRERDLRWVRCDRCGERIFTPIKDESP